MPEQLIPYAPEVAAEALTTIEEAIDVESTEAISIDEYRDLLALAINDAEVWISQAERLIDKIDSGEKIKGTKLNGAVRNGRLEAVRSSLTDVKTAKVAG